jgi:hypothetical protein
MLALAPVCLIPQAVVERLAAAEDHSVAPPTSAW